MAVDSVQPVPWVFSDSILVAVKVLTSPLASTSTSVIATYLAEGHPLEEAVSLGKEYVYQAIAAAKDHKIGRGHGSTNHFWKLKTEN